MKWNELVVSDLKKGDLLEDWRKIAQDRGAWRCLVEEALGEINKQAEVREKERKDERKCRREGNAPPESSSWQCEKAGCAFIGQSKARLVNHARQIHGWMAGIKEQCPNCGRAFRTQGFKMHKLFCHASSQMYPQPAPS